MISGLNQPHFLNADKAREYLETVRWPNGPICPHCGAVGSHYPIKGGRAGLWKCKDCKVQFTVTVKTVFERSKIPLNIWLQAVYLLCSSKKGMSSHQLHRTFGLTYKTAWFMTHRIRKALESGSGMMGGGGKVVEADETYFGKREDFVRAPGKYGGSTHKHKIFALVERDGTTRAFHVPAVNGATLKPILQAQVAKDSKFYTDSASHWRNMPRGTFKKHAMVNHLAKEYARGDVHTNTVEGFFSLLKRGLIGTYHHVSEAHLQRYCHEFSFRFAYRELIKDVGGHKKRVGGYNDQERTENALKLIGGKRLTYRRINGSTKETAH